MTTSTTTTGTRIRVLTVAITGASGAILAPLLTGALAERLAVDLDLGSTGLGLVLAAFFATSSSLSAHGGRLADRLGWPLAIRLAGLLSAGSLVFIATVADTVALLMVGLVLGGTALSVAMPASSLAIARDLPGDRQGLLFGLKQTAVPLAGLLAGLAVPAIALTIGWRWAFAAGAMVPLIAVVLAPVGRMALRSSATGRVDASQAPLPSAFKVVAVGGAFAAVAVSGLATFLLASAVDAGISEGDAGLLVAVTSVAGLSTRVTAGHLADRVRSGGFVPVVGMLVGGVFGFGLLAVHSPVSTVVGALIAYVLGWGWPGLFYFGAVLHRPERPGAAAGAVQTGLSGGSALGPLLFGLLVDTGGFTTAWAVAAVAMLLGAALVARGASRLHQPA